MNNIFSDLDTIRNLNVVAGDGTCCPYECLLDYSVGSGRLANIPYDVNACVRPLGYTKSITNNQNCGKCGVHESVERRGAPASNTLTVNDILPAFS